MKLRAVLLTVLLGTVACDREETPTGASDPAVLESAGTWRPMEELAGDVFIQPASDGYEVLLGLDVEGPDGVPDGIVDRIAVLQRLGPQAPASRLRVPDARVVREPSAVVVLNAEGRTLVRLALQDRRLGAGDRQRLRTASGSLLDARGYGLSWREGAWSAEEGWLTTSDLRRACGRPAPVANGAPFSAESLFDEATCDSGGAGSTSCNVGCINSQSCGVTCSAGYYSCCDIARCDCICVAIDKAPKGTG